MKTEHLDNVINSRRNDITFSQCGRGAIDDVTFNQCDDYVTLKDDAKANDSSTLGTSDAKTLPLYDPLYAYNTCIDGGYEGGYESPSDDLPPPKIQFLDNANASGCDGTLSKQLQLCDCEFICKINGVASGAEAVGPLGLAKGRNCELADADNCCAAVSCETGKPGTTFAPQLENCSCCSHSVDGVGGAETLSQQHRAELSQNCGSRSVACGGAYSPLFAAHKTECPDCEDIRRHILVNRHGGGVLGREGGGVRESGRGASRTRQQKIERSKLTLQKE